MDHSKFLGTWKITEFVTSCATEFVLEGIKFSLDETGDVTFWINDHMLGAWDSPSIQTKEPFIPLLECDSYEINIINHVGSLEFIKEEKVAMEFVIPTSPNPNDTFIMVSEPYSLMVCRLPDEPIPQQISEHPFSFLSALHGEFFSDVVITADNNTQFKVHSIILKLTGLCGDSNRFISLDGLPEQLLKTILHWGYTNSLHPDITVEICQEIIKLGESALVLTSLVKNCKMFISNMEMKQRLEHFVSDMNASVNQCVNHITCNASKSPVQLCQSLKNSLKELSIAGAHFLEFSLYLQNHCTKMNSTDRHEILRYSFSIFPVFVKLLYEALKGAWESFTQLTPSQKQDLAQYIIPETEGFFNSFISVCTNAKQLVERIIDIVDIESARDSANKSKVVMRNKCDYGYNEITILKFIHCKVTYLMLFAMDKRECFTEMNQNERLRSVSHNFDMISDEFPLFILRLEAVVKSIDDKCDAYEFNFGFKITTSTVAGILQRIIPNPQIAERFVEQICSIVQSDRFSQIMTSVGLLKRKTQKSDESNSSGSLAHANDSKLNWTGPTNEQQSDLNCHLNLGKVLYSPPGPERSLLARKATKLLYSEKYTDMEFIIIPTSEDKSPDTASSRSDVSDVANSPDMTVIRAHRVIVAARCPWFQRALLSGMIEDRNRKILIYDTSPSVFKEFLLYLYGNGISQTCLSNQDSLSELMLLADRYEVDELKKVAEFVLITGVDNDSVIYLLSIADQINADALKSTCLEYIALNPKLIKTDLCTKLPEDLQNEIQEFITWTKPLRRPSKFRDRLPHPPPPPRCPQSPTSTLHSQMSERDSFGDLEEMMLHGDNSSLLSLDSLSRESDEQLDSCLTLIRDIVGPTPSNDCLVRVILAADYDVNRAVNFYYQSDQNVP